MSFKIIIAYMIINAFSWLGWICFAEAAATIVDKVATSEKVVALTIEDIRDGGEFEAVLQALREQGIKATLFISGDYITKLPVKKALSEGHEFGNYGMKHEYWGEWSENAIKEDLTEAAKVLSAATGDQLRVFRPPYYYYGDNFIRAVGATTTDPLVIRGMDTADWTLDSPEAVVEKVKESAANGDIINVNMRAKHAATALPSIIKELKQKGYSFVTVSELWEKGHRSEQPQTWGVSEVAVFRAVPSNKPYVALTFDDGGPGWRVSEILEILKENNVKSTFFLLGNWVRANPEMARRIASEGHEIANHSYSHPRFNSMGPEEMREEIRSTNAVIQEITGRMPARLFRPPYGIYNSTLTGVLGQAGYKALVMWSIDPRDWSGVSAEAIASVANSEAEAGSIILLHLQGPNTPDAIRLLIPRLTSRGYILTTVGNMIS